MDRAEWIGFLDANAAAHSEARTRLWNAALALLVAGASIAVFVARAFDASSAPPLRLQQAIMALGLSASAYVVIGHRIIRRFIRTTPPIRRGPHAPDPATPRTPFSYDITEPRAVALWVVAAVLLLLSTGSGSRVSQMSGVIGTLFMIAAACWLWLRPSLTGAWAAEVDKRAHFGASFGLLVFMIGGSLIVGLGSMLEAIQSIEAGLATLGLASVPALLLSGLQLLRHATFDESHTQLEQLRLDARRLEMPPGAIEAAYFRLEQLRERGPVRQTDGSGDVMASDVDGTIGSHSERGSKGPTLPPRHAP